MLDPVKDLPPEVRHYRTKSRQTFLVIGHSLPLVPVAEQATLDVLNHILAGAQDEGLDGWGASNRLVGATRVRSGLADHATGFIEPHWYGSGSYSFRAHSRPEALRQLYETMMAELDRIRAGPVSDEELSAARNALADGMHEMRFVNGEATARTLALEYLQHGNHAVSSTYQQRVRAVTADGVLHAARKYVRPNHFQVIVLGDPIELRVAPPQ